MPLAEEMLLGGANYLGQDLKERGIPFPVLAQHEVMPYALERARQLAEKPRISLITLKNHLVARWRRELPAMITQEVAMHATTFHQPEVRQNIMNSFGK